MSNPWHADVYGKADRYELMRTGVQIYMRDLPNGYRFYDADADIRYHCKSDHPRVPGKIVWISPDDVDQIKMCRAETLGVQVRSGGRR